MRPTTNSYLQIPIPGALSKEPTSPGSVPGTGQPQNAVWRSSPAARIDCKERPSGRCGSASENFPMLPAGTTSKPACGRNGAIELPMLSAKRWQSDQIRGGWLGPGFRDSCFTVLPQSRKLFQPGNGICVETLGLLNVEPHSVGHSIVKPWSDAVTVTAVPPVTVLTVGVRPPAYRNGTSALFCASVV